MLIVVGRLRVRTQVCRQTCLVANPQTDLSFLDLNGNLHDVNSVFASQKETSYSNIGFDLLGQVLAKVTNMKYEDYIKEAILKPLGMHETSFTVPAASVAASAGSGSDWGVDEGADNP